MGGSRNDGTHCLIGSETKADGTRVRLGVAASFSVTMLAKQQLCGI